jgi:hypothetical protein
MQPPRLFGAERGQNLMQRLGLAEGVTLPVVDSEVAHFVGYFFGLDEFRVSELAPVPKSSSAM